MKIGADRKRLAFLGVLVLVVFCATLALPARLRV